MIKTDLDQNHAEAQYQDEYYCFVKSPKFGGVGSQAG
jgi:hypothetical protein